MFIIKNYTFFYLLLLKPQKQCKIQFAVEFWLTKSRTVKLDVFYILYTRLVNWESFYAKNCEYKKIRKSNLLLFTEFLIQVILYNWNWSLDHCIALHSVRLRLLSEDIVDLSHRYNFGMLHTSLSQISEFRRIPDIGSAKSQCNININGNYFKMTIEIVIVCMKLTHATIHDTFLLPVKEPNLFANIQLTAWEIVTPKFHFIANIKWTPISFSRTKAIQIRW